MDPHARIVRQGHGQGGLAHAGQAIRGEGRAVAGGETGDQVGEEVGPRPRRGAVGRGGDVDPEVGVGAAW